MNKEIEKVFTERGFTNIEQMATMFDYYKQEIERLNNVINKALHKLRASKDHFKTERENNTIVFVIRILESDK